MIITSINGGLGNQLFQYAAGLALAKRYQTDLKIHVQFKEGDTNRSVGLSHFKIDLKEAAPEEVIKLYPRSAVEKIWQKLLPTSLKKYYQEKNFAFNPKFTHLSANIYLKGYWQSEYYFSIIKDEIHAAFTLQPSVYQRALATIEELRKIDSVAIHVRKGDYLIAPYDTYYTNLDSSYYNKAIQLILSANKAIQLFVFTDDPDWVQNNLHLQMPYSLISSVKTHNMYEDFQAMRSCKYHIIANSSFSWWTAWLSDRNGKIVVAPKQWFNLGPKDTQHLLPKTWLTV